MFAVFRCVFCLLLLLIGSWCPAQEMKVTVTTVDGRVLSGQLAAISETGQLSGTSLDDLKLDEVLSIKTEQKANAPAGSIEVLTLPDGKVTCDSIRLNEDGAVLIRKDARTQLPLGGLKAIIWENSPIVADAIQSPSNEVDRVIVDVNGQLRSVDGLLEAVDAEGVQLNYQGKSRRIGKEKVRAIISADLDLPKASGTLASVELKDGSRWTGVVESLETDRLKLKLNRSDGVTLPANQLVAISVKSDRLRFLSDMVPLEVRENAMFTVDRPFQKDRSVAGGKLILRINESGEFKTFTKGLGTHATSELVFANENQFDRLRGWVGIDASTRGRGDCNAKILGDGIELWSARVQGNLPGKPLDIDVSGIQQVTLIVEPGVDFDLADHLNWCNLRFLKTQ